MLIEPSIPSNSVNDGSLKSVTSVCLYGHYLFGLLVKIHVLGFCDVILSTNIGPQARRKHLGWLFGRNRVHKMTPDFIMLISVEHPGPRWWVSVPHHSGRRIGWGKGSGKLWPKYKPQGDQPEKCFELQHRKILFNHLDRPIPNKIFTHTQKPVMYAKGWDRRKSIYGVTKYYRIGVWDTFRIGFLYCNDPMGFHSPYKKMSWSHEIETIFWWKNIQTAFEFGRQSTSFRATKLLEIVKLEIEAPGMMAISGPSY